MFNELIIWLQATAGTDPTAFFTMSLMCSVGAYMTKDTMPSPNFAFLAYPLLVACSILAFWAFSQYGFFQTRQMAAWLVAVTTSSSIGMIAGLSIFIGFVRCMNMIMDRKVLR